METNTLVQVLVALCSIVVAGKISMPCNTTRHSAQNVAVRWMSLRCGFGGMEPIHHSARQSNSATLRYLDQYAASDLQGKLPSWESKIYPEDSTLVGEMKFTHEEPVFVFKKQ